MNIEENIRLYKKNLLLVSLIVFFYYYSGASIEGVKFSGLSASFHNEDALIHMLWAIWLYFFIRYCQYYLTYGMPIIFKSANEAFVKKIGPALLNMEEMAYEMMPDDDYLKRSIIKPKFFIGFHLACLPHAYKSKKYSVAKIFFHPLFDRPKKKIRNKNAIAPKINLLKKNHAMRFSRALYGLLFAQIIQCEVTVYPVATRYVTSQAQKTTHCLNSKQTKCAFTAIVNSILINPIFSEYFIPILIGLTPVVYYLFF